MEGKKASTQSSSWRTEAEKPRKGEADKDTSNAASRKGSTLGAKSANNSTQGFSVNGSANKKGCCSKCGKALPEKQTRLDKKAPCKSNFEINLLFNRLDRDNDLRLSKDEFKRGVYDYLKMKVDAKALDEVFDKYDTNGDKHLQVAEFTGAYSDLYKLEEEGNFANETINSTKPSPNSYIIKATRYGSTISAERGLEFICELYLIKRQTMFNRAPCKVCHQVTRLSPAIGFKYWIPCTSPTTDDHNWSKNLQNAVQESWPSKDATHDGDALQNLLMEMIEKDSLTNKEGTTDISWWVDCSCYDVGKMKSDLIKWFKLPKDEPKLVSMLSSFDSQFSDDINDRIFIGNDNGKDSELDSTTSVLSIFIQALSFPRTPIFKLPSFQDFGLFCNDYLVGISDYLCTRFPFWISIFHKNGSVDNTRMFDTYDYASALVYERIFEKDELVMNAFNKAKNAKSSAFLNDSWKDFRSAEPLPLHNSTSHSKMSTNFMTSTATHILNNKPHFTYDSLGIYLLDFGYGCNCLVTIREIDDETKDVSSRSSDAKNTLPQGDVELHSRSGIFGRIFYGLWLKLVELTINNGRKNALSELDDSPATLASTIMCIVHDFTRQNTIGPLNFWMDVLEDEVNDIVVSKHSAHCQRIDKLLDEIKLYVEPWCSFLTNLIGEAQDEEYEQHQIEMYERIESVSVSSIGEGRMPTQSRRGSIGSGLAGSTRGRRHSITRGRFDPQVTASPRASTEPSSSTAANDDTLHIIEEDCVDLAPEKDLLPKNVEKLEFKLHLMKHFFGKDSIWELSHIRNGYSKYSFRGMKTWSSNVQLLMGRSKELKTTMKNLMEEKRQFTNFLLTIITVLFAPLTILTGYWGMNFDNMAELSESTYPSIPGVHIMWTSAIIIYGIILMLAIHYRVIYSAS